MDKIKKFIETEKNLVKAKDFDTFFDKSHDTIKRSPDKAFELLQTLDLQAHTVGICYILIPLFQLKDIHSKINLRELIMYCRSFLYEFSPAELERSSLYSTAFHIFVRYFTYSLLHGDSDKPHWKSDSPAAFYLSRPLLGIKSLKKAIEKLQTKDTQLTICHSYFALLCVAAKAYRHALPVISKKVLSGFSHGHFEFENIMNYNYYRGLIFTALEDYDQAKHSFKLVIDTPFHALHIVQVNAFKKLVLLIWLTSTPNLNDNEHKSVRLEVKAIVHSKGLLGKHLEEACINYGKADCIHNFFIFQNYDEIIKDTNLGLVKQVIKKLRNEVIESITLTNTMLGIDEIEARLKNHREFCDVREEQEK
jgi:hypothetical protein